MAMCLKTGQLFDHFFQKRTKNERGIKLKSLMNKKKGGIKKRRNLRGLAHFAESFN
jgi:hypothetical protein